MTDAHLFQGNSRTDILGEIFIMLQFGVLSSSPLGFSNYRGVEMRAANVRTVPASAVFVS